MFLASEKAVLITIFLNFLWCRFWSPLVCETLSPFKVALNIQIKVFVFLTITDTSVKSTGSIIGLADRGVVKLNSVWLCSCQKNN